MCISSVVTVVQPNHLSCKSPKFPFSQLICTASFLLASNIGIRTGRMHMYNVSSDAQNT